MTKSFLLLFVILGVAFSGCPPKPPTVADFNVSQVTLNIFYWEFHDLKNISPSMLETGSNTLESRPSFSQLELLALELPIYDQVILKTLTNTAFNNID